MRSSSVRFRFSCLGASSAPSGALPLDAGAGAAGAGVARLRPLVPPTTPRSTTFAAGASPPRPPLRPPNCVNAFCAGITPQVQLAVSMNTIHCLPYYWVYLMNANTIQ